MKDESNATTELVRAETQWNRGWDERWETGAERQRETGGEAEWEGGWKTESEMEGERQRMSDRECVWETENEWLRVCEGERGRVSVWEIERACSGCLGHRPIPPPLPPPPLPWPATLPYSIPQFSKNSLNFLPLNEKNKTGLLCLLRIYFTQESQAVMITKKLKIVSFF